MKSLGLHAIHYRYLTIFRQRFSNILGRCFSLKIVLLLYARKPEHFTSGSGIEKQLSHSLARQKRNEDDIFNIMLTTTRAARLNYKTSYKQS